MDKTIRCFSIRLNSRKKCRRWGYNRPLKKTLSVKNPKINERKGISY
jgi:hypothetical protein